MSVYFLWVFFILTKVDYTYGYMINRTNKRGFTIVELLIVIVVIAILAAISIVAYNGIQQRARDSERQSDINVMQKQLELFYVDKGYYPLTESLLGGNGFSFAANNFSNAGPGYMVAPNNTDKTVSSYRDFSSPPNNLYGYIAYKSDNTRCSSASGDTTSLCKKYTLYYATENPVATKSLSSLNN